MRSASTLASGVPAIGLVERMKMRFRPYICPFHLLLPHIVANRSYYDIGCGSGMFLKMLADCKSPTALGGVEISERLIENARFALRMCKAGLSLRVYDGFELPWEVEEYDYVFLIDVLHHLPRGRQLDFIDRLYDRMRPGQRLILKDIDAASLLVYWNKFHDLCVSKQIGCERRASDVRDRLQRVGFRIAECFSTRVFLYPHYTVLCVR
jgi:2-polyprenyl-3-methyl-5-hydroxy-6-metoxy-1,4-benzoquinol methylase